MRGMRLTIALILITTAAGCGGEDEPDVPDRLTREQLSEGRSFWDALSAEQRGDMASVCKSAAASEADTGSAPVPAGDPAYAAVINLDTDDVQAALDRHFSQDEEGEDSIDEACGVVTQQLVFDAEADAERRANAREEARQRQLEAQSCDAKGINAQKLREGPCTDEGGTKVKVVNRDTTLSLPELTVSYGGYTTAETLSSSVGTERADGVYVTIRLTITNKLPDPVAFDPEQVALYLADKTFTPDFDADNMPGDSFVWESDEIQPGNSRTGTVTFDVAPAAARAMDTSGNIGVAQFSDAGQDAKRRIGLIRTYH